MRKKFTMLLATFLVCLGGVKAETVITDLAKLTDGMECIISTSGRGGWAVNADGTSFGSTNDCGFGTTVDATKDQQIFQFQKIEESFYLYSTYAQKYVNKDKTLSEDAKDAIYFIAETGVANTFIVKFDNDHIINIGGSNQIVISGWGDISSEYDDGNRVTITNATESLKNSLSDLVTSAEETTENLNSKDFSELTTLEESINKANTALEGTPTRTVLKEKIAELTNAKAAAEAYPFVPSLLKEIEPSRYFIYYTDENNTKHYLQTTGANSVVTVTENPISYDIQAGTTEDGKFTTAYTIKMNGLYISNTSNDATNIETKDQVQLWSSQVVFEMNGKSAIRLTNATAENTWHGHYFINKGDENTTIASDPSLGENLFIWTIEPDLQGMRDELAVLKEKATTLKTQLTNKPEGSAPIENAVITALSTAIEYAEANKDSNNSETLNTGITQLNDAINNASVNAFGSGVLAMLNEGEYVIYYKKGNTKYYLSNDKTNKKVVTSTSPLVYDVYKGQTENGYSTYAYYLDMNESKISNPSDGKVGVENKGDGGTFDNYSHNRVWESQVLYVNSQGKYAIRSTNYPGSDWNSDAFITISEDGTTVSGQNTDLSDALYIWNIENVDAEASINNVKYETLTAAINAAEAGATVTLIKDITLTSSLTFTKDLTIDLNGKSIMCESSDVFVVENGTLTIDGEGLVYGSERNNGNSCAVWVNGANAKAIINNGTYKVGGDINGTTDKRNDCIYVGKAGGTIEIYGGVFEYTGNVKDGSLDDGSRFLVNQNNEHATQLITIYGGTFHNFDPANAKTDEPWMTNGVGSFVAIGYSSVAGENNTYEVKKGIFNETALKAAIAAGNTEVTLDANIDLTSSVMVSSDLIVNLNEESIKCASSDVFVVTAGTLTINGDGLVYGSENNSSNSCAVWARENGIVIINGGTYKVGHDGASKSANRDNWRNDCIYARDNAQIIINGGEFMYTGDINTTNFQSDGNRFLLNCRDADYKAGTSSITVKGGTFHNFNPAATSSENPVASYVPVGYSSVAGEKNTYEVKEGIFNETALKAAIAAGQDVTLGADIEVSSAVQVADVINLNLNDNTITRATGYEGYVFEVTGELIVTGGTIAQSGICYIINDADYKTEAGKTYEISAAKENVDIQYTRTFGHNSWQVLFVPFDIPLANMSEFEVYSITGMNNDNTAIIVNPVTENLVANTPYFIKAKAAGDKVIKVENATLTVPQAYEATYGNYTLHGTYTSMAITKETEFVLTGGEWCQLDNSDQVLGAFRAYLTANVNGAPALRIVTRGETDIETIDAQPATEAIYDLTGRKVETMDKGIYIVNGRKVVIK